jgi:hypothetical protein
MKKLSLVVLMGVLLAVLLPMAAFASPAAQVVCAGAPAVRLSVGMVARPAQAYSTLWAAPENATALAVMYKATGDTFTITAAPRCYMGFNWYQVNFKGLVGYVTEGKDSTYWVEQVSGVVPTAAPTVAPAMPTATPAIMPTAAATAIPAVPTATPTLSLPPVATATGACVGAPAPRLSVGSVGRPAQVYSSLRSAIDGVHVTATLYRAKGDTFTVVAGPFCGKTPHNWYYVNFNGQAGYVTEGIGSTYWIEKAS